MVTGQRLERIDEQSMLHLPIVVEFDAPAPVQTGDDHFAAAIRKRLCPPNARVVLLGLRDEI